MKELLKYSENKKKLLKCVECNKNTRKISNMRI